MINTILLVMQMLGGFAGELYFKTKIESSDMIIREGKIYIVDDEGGLLTVNGGKQTLTTKGIKGLDLEGITFNPKEPSVVYLGQESPPTLIKYDVANKKVVKKYPLKDFPDADGNGMEALTYVPAMDAFFCGSQADGSIHIYRLENNRLNKIGTFQAPGADSDLAGMTVEGNRIYFLFDDPQIIAVSELQISGDNVELSNTKTFSIKIPDAEGIAVDASWVYICKDSGPVYRIDKKLFQLGETDNEAIIGEEILDQSI
ncbi:MAG: hypothetical protein ABIQ95_09625 [Bdellovibrionia bacterium]